MKKRDLLVQALGGREPDVVIKLPYLPPSEFSRNSRAHWSKLNRIKDDIASDVVALLHQQGYRSPHKPFQKAEVLFTFTVPDLIDRDGDNLITAAVPITNALKGRIFRDDCLDCIDVPWYDHEIRRGVRQTTVEIWDTSQQERML